MRVRPLASGRPLVEAELGGALVYAVCAITREEGEQQIGAFIERHKSWSSEDPFIGAASGIGRPAGAGRLLTPHHDSTDGFFVARLRAG